ncbi:MAG: tetratricopeptide repeat protein [Limisphaerales bacterium]
MKRKRLKPKRAAPSSRPPEKAAAPATVPGPPRTAARRAWLRVAALVSPLFLLLLVELGLRLAGWGYPTSFFLEAQENGQTVLIENRRFSWRFFPPTAARKPYPLAIRVKKPPGTVRVFVFGESAAMGDPDASYGLSRQLERILQAQHPGNQIEVLNVAMTGVNSHAMREIALACRRVESDFWVIYAGNNEVIGPFGAGTVFGGRAPGLRTVRLLLAMKTTRLGQLIERLGRWGKEPPQWAGMQMFVGRQVPWDDPRLKNVYANFAANLASVVSLGRQAGAGVLLATMPVNLKDSPPFASRHRPGLSASQRAAWEALLTQAAQAESAGRLDDALSACQQASRIDADYAELSFRWAGCLLRLGQTTNALGHFQRARDLDTLRFRADSPLNAIIRQVAVSQHASPVDAEAACAGLAAGGVPGDELFYDHVHLNFAGNLAVATLLAAELQKQWPGPAAPSATNPPSGEDLARRLAFSDFDRRRLAEEMRLRLQQPPFSGQSNFHQRDEQWRRRIAELKSPPQDSVPVYQAALALAPGDWRLHANFSDLLEAQGDLSGAMTQLHEATRLLDHFPDLWLNLGNLACQAGRYAEAERFCNEALKRTADPDLVLNELGLIASATGRHQQATQLFKRTLRLKPDSSGARINLAMELTGAGDIRGAISQYWETLRRETNNVAARNNLGILLSREGRVDQAIDLFQTVLRLQPGQWQANYNLARIMARRGRLAEAAALYEAALQGRPAWPEAQLALGALLAQLGKDTEALQRFAAATRLAPTSVEARFNYALSLLKARRLAEAQEQLRITLSLQPDHPDAARCLGQVSQLLGSTATNQ